MLTELQDITKQNISNKSVQTLYQIVVLEPAPAKLSPDI